MAMQAVTSNRDPVEPATATSAAGAAPPGPGWLIAAATAATLLLPAALLYARAIGDAVLTVIAVLFIASRFIASRFIASRFIASRFAAGRLTADRSTGPAWRWLRAPWTLLMAAFWGWMLLCTVLVGTGPAILQALAAARFFLFAAALENWVLADPRTRRRLWYVILATALWILVEIWQQYLLGLNLFGYPRWLDGALTGPFKGPVAGPMFLAVFFPAFLPLSFLLLRQPNRIARLGGVAVPILASATMILIGQRMPAVLMLLGLCLSGLLFRPLRLPVALSLGAGAGVLALLPIISPPTFAKLVVHFGDQMAHFWVSQYGLIFGRAVTMIQAHPWLGLGWDGYRDDCMQPQYLRGVSWLPIPDPASEQGCSIHPHNYWLQVGTGSGLLGMLLFAALAAVWLWRIGAGAAAPPNDRRSAVFVMLFVMLWPIASATSMFTVPNAGWIFLMVGWGLAEAGWPAPSTPRIATID